MRRFVPAAPPDGWRELEQRWNAQWVARVNAAPTAAFAWYQSDKRTARDIALPGLMAQTGRHCSFCDAFPASGVSQETIEHFRPKNAKGFPERAYTWENLYFCCDGCQGHKRELWDEAFLAPDAEDYSFIKYFEFDFTTGAIRPSLTAKGADRERAATTIRLYGLDSPQRRVNRRMQLNQWDRMNPADRVLNQCAYRDFLEEPSAAIRNELTISPKE